MAENVDCSVALGCIPNVGVPVRTASRYVAFSDASGPLTCQCSPRRKLTGNLLNTKFVDIQRRAIKSLDM